MSIKALGKQSLVYGIGTILTRLVTFLLLPLYTNVFSPGEYGVVALAYAFTGFVVVFYRYGMDTALMKYYIDADESNKSQYFSTIFSTQTITSILFSGAVFIAARALSPIFLGGEFTDLMKLVAIILLFDTLREIPLLVLRANEKAKQYIAFSLLNVLLLMMLNIYFVVFKQMGITGVLIGNVFASGLVLLAILPIIIKNFNFSSINTTVLKEVLKFGLPFLPAALFTMIMDLSDRYLLEWLAETSDVGLYAAGSNFGKFGLLIIMGFNMGWTPYFLRIGKEDNAKELFARVAKYFLGIMGFFIVFIVLWIDSIVRFSFGGVSFFGEEYWSSTQIVSVLLIGYYFFGLYVLQLPGVFHTDRTKLVPVFRGTAAALMVLLSIILIPLLGIMGAAYSKLLAYVVMALMIWLNNKKYYEIKYSWMAIFFPIIYMAIISIIPLTIIIKIFILFVYVLLWYILVADNYDKDRIKSIVK